MARRTKLTPEIQKAVCEKIEIGNTYERACLLCGIAPRTFYYWKSKGETSKRGKFLQFLQSVNEASEKCIAFNVAIIIQAAKGTKTKAGDWRAAAWYLERKVPEEFGRRVAVQAQLDGKIEHSVSPESQKKLDAIFNGEIGGDHPLAGPVQIDG